MDTVKIELGCLLVLGPVLRCSRINHINRLMKSLRTVVNRTEVRPHAGKAARELLPSEIKGRAQNWAVPSYVDMTLGPKPPKLCLAMVLSLNRAGAYCDCTLEC